MGTGKGVVVIKEISTAKGGSSVYNHGGAGLAMLNLAGALMPVLLKIL
jgi:hypothetical protein